MKNTHPFPKDILHILVQYQLQFPKMNVRRLLSYEAKLLFSEGCGRMKPFETWVGLTAQPWTGLKLPKSKFGVLVPYVGHRFFAQNALGNHIGPLSWMHGMIKLTTLTFLGHKICWNWDFARPKGTINLVQWVCTTPEKATRPWGGHRNVSKLLSYR